MKKNCTTLTMWVLALIVACSVTGHATSGKENPFKFVFKPIEHPNSAGPVLMEFVFSVDESFCKQWKCCEHIEVEVRTSDSVHLISNRQWDITLDESLSYETTISADIPPNDTSSIIVKLTLANGGQVKAYAYFVTTGDSVEFWKGYPQKPFYDRSGWKPDTVKYEVKVDLRSRRQRRFIFEHEDVIGSIVPTADSGFYIIRITRYQFEGLRSEGVDCEYLEEPPPYPSGPPGNKIIWERDTTGQVRPMERKRDPQGR